MQRTRSAATAPPRSRLPVRLARAALRRRAERRRSAAVARAPASASRTARQALGIAAEQAALELLAGQGLCCVARNVRNRAGELDLVMRDGPLVVIVEVRCRRAGGCHGGAAATVDRRKQRRVRAATGLLLQSRPRLASQRLRFDVVAVTADGCGGLQCEWLRDAFRA